MPPTRWDVKQIPCLQQGTNNKKSGSCWLHVLNFKGKSKKILSSWRCQIDLERKAYQQIMWKLFFEQHLSHEVQRTLIRSQLWQDLKGNMFQRNEWIVGQSIQSMRVWGAAWLTCRVKFHWNTWHNLCLTFWSPQHSFPTASVNQKIGAGDANRSGPMSKTPAHGSDNMLHQKGNLLPFMVLLSGPGWIKSPKTLLHPTPPTWRTLPWWIQRPPLDTQQRYAPSTTAKGINMKTGTASGTLCGDIVRVPLPTNMHQIGVGTRRL